MKPWHNKYSVRPPLLLMASIESLILFSSVYMAGLLVFGSLAASHSIFGSLAPIAILVTTVILVCLVTMGLYEFNQRLRFREAAARVVVGIGLGSLGLGLLSLLFPSIMISTKFAGVAVLYSLTLLLLVRYFFIRTVDDNVFRLRTIIFGAGERATSIHDLRRRADRRGFKIVGQVAAPGDNIQPQAEEIETDVKSLADFALQLDADEIVIAMDERRGNLPIRELLDAKFKGVNIIGLVEFLEREAGKIRIDLVSPGWLVFTPGFRMSKIRRFNKRVVDLLVSASLLLLVWPVMLLVTIAIKIEDGLAAPVFYRQLRVGRGERDFEVIKFRSMKVNAEPDGKAVWASKNDSRITRVGGVLRLTRLDELPQLFNVLKGEMSLVGPRPERPEFVKALEQNIPYYAERHIVQPGLTGWAQLKYSYGASEKDAIEKLHYDLYYIKNQSLMLDLRIILQTVEVVLWGRGAR